MSQSSIQPANQTPTDPYLAASGTFTDPRKIRDNMAWLRLNSHLISPATAVTQLPEGCAVSVTMVYLNQATDAHSVGGGKFALLKHAVMALANAAGVVFDPMLSCRLDDGSDPRYVNWRAVGGWRALDGTMLSLTGDKELDLRDGSDQAEAIAAKAKDQATAKTQLREVRTHIQSHAQTKAELRAIRKALGITSYIASDFNRPWCVVKLSFTGHSNDPEIRRMNAQAIQQSMLGGIGTMFRPAAPIPHQQLQGTSQAHQALPSVHVQQTHRHLPPPPVGSSRDYDEDSYPDLSVQARPVQNQAPATPTQQAIPTPRTPAPEGSSKPFAFGSCKGKLPSEVTEKDLEWYIGASLKSADDPAKANFRDKNLAEVEALRAELARRNSAPEGQY